MIFDAQQKSMLRQSLARKLYEYGVPPHDHQALLEYLLNGVPTGDFLRLVLSNDLFGAFGRADDINSKRLKEICSFLYNEFPSSAYGSPQDYLNWIELHRKERATNETN